MPESTPRPRGVRFLVVDDEALFRFGVSSSLVIHGSVDDTAFGLEAVKLAVDVDVVVVGSPADMPRVELARRLRALDASPQLVVLLASVVPEEVGALIALPVDGLLARGTGPDALALACERVVAGEQAIDPQLLADHEAQNATEAGFVLTARERDVLVLLADGRSNREIAAELFVSLPTVKTHLAHIYAKLESKNRNEALGRAVALGLLA
ncbi:MAG: LuxR C-terminal-related transcriptional regulator [Acidimicrobiia bacterium]